MNKIHLPQLLEYFSAGDLADALSKAGYLEREHWPELLEPHVLP